MSKVTVDFEFDINDVVKTQFVNNGVITMLGYETENVRSYFVENTAQGIINKWFRASDLILAE